MELGSGLNVLTGETGAGKSIVVDSVNLALGGRADRDLIRTGSDKATVQAVFDIAGNEKVCEYLADIGLEDEDGMLVISRELSASGRNICRVSGSVVPLAQLKQLTTLLVDMHGQHEHQSLLSAGNHLNYLDNFGGAEHAQKMQMVKAVYLEYKSTQKQLKKLSEDKADRERRLDLIRFQLEEIEVVRLKPDEDSKLEKQNRLLENAEKIADSVNSAYNLVYMGSDRSPSAQESLRSAADSLSLIAEVDERYNDLYRRLDEAYYLVQDIGYELQNARDGIEYDPDRAEKVAARLDTINRLKKKYGPDLGDVIAFRETLKRDLEMIEEGDEALERLSKKLEEDKKKLVAANKDLSESRRALACKFVEKMLVQLQDLGMERVRFQVHFEPNTDEESAFTERGNDVVEFLISPNPGEPVKPLANVASGGELSRIMLALKVIAADQEGVDCMIFDEIDTGISGRMAQVVGEKMAAIAAKRQVICVTHLPQIAALGDEQFVVEKQIQSERTDSSVHRLDRAGRISELARMVGGADQGESGLIHAENMLDSAQKRVEEIRSSTNIDG